ncbi:MAG: hypothetical protein RL675_1254 [Bacteroidota bacterium]
MIKILPSPELLLLVWLFSAGISITGGLVIAGMGLAYPDARDLLDYYRILFPKWVVWIFNHMSIWVINIAGTVAVAFVFAEYLTYFLPLDAMGVKFAAIALVLLLGAMDMWNMKAADRFQIFFTAVKVGALLLLIGLLLIPGKGNMQNFEMSHTESWSTFKLIGAFVAACTGALNALDGWYMVSHITPEVKGGVKTVKKAIVWGLLICTGLYLLTAFAYQYILTPEEMGSTHLVAVKALEKELGGIAPMVIDCGIGVDFNFELCECKSYCFITTHRKCCRSKNDARCFCKTQQKKYSYPSIHTHAYHGNIFHPHWFV